MITPSRTILLANSAPYINGKQRYAVNGVSHDPADTPLKLADYFNIPGVFNLGRIPTWPNSGNNAYFQTSVMAANLREYVEIVFQNWEDTVQSWHIDGVSEVVDRHLRGSGQRGDVEYKVRELGQTISRAAVLSQGIIACKFMERRIAHPTERSPLWPGQRAPYQAFLIYVNITMT
ncbi:hypothetical protein F3Y22_tig00110647pilonHSYRG00121 [Hibiscus syriacus]|uniref:Plastocyanin-like domain-containing protein n=1 Tax=Hibiscus syriacus TaxID=106335 RepID=A0A6A3A066_HIBSY|nr:hypothetical protein F3Y22_tig00110647pilonHSYRG00121 [Hibiscus syriacus]